MKKYLSVILTLAMLLALLVGPVSADGLIGNMETDVQINGLSELSVRTLVSRYFAQRKAYLQGTSDTINAAVTPMVTDEATHKEVLAEANAVLADSTEVINTVVIGDYMANVEATETATFAIDGELVQESVVHTICVYIKNDGSLVVGSDGYMVTATGFISASYVNAGAVELARTVPTGAPECIISVAYNEIGTAPDADGTTKYGRWYNGVTGLSGYEDAPWCASFVAWCANRADVPITVIPLTAYVPTMATFFNNQGRYYRSISAGGSYTPQPGDIIFTGVNDNDSLYSPGHVGIVSFVANGVVYFVEGNATYYSNGVPVKQVWLSSRSLTATDILAYGNPNYTASTHTLSYWEYDEYMHWSTCEACGDEIFEDHDFADTDYGFGCRICGYVQYK